MHWQVIIIYLHRATASAPNRGSIVLCSTQTYNKENSPCLRQLQSVWQVQQVNASDK